MGESVFILCFGKLVLLSILVGLCFVQIGDGYCLIVQFVGGIGCKRIDFVIGIKVGQYSCIVENCFDGFDFFVDLFVYDQFFVDIIDQNGQIWCCQFQYCVGGFGGEFGVIDQFVGVGMYQFQVVVWVDFVGQCQVVVCFVNVENGVDQVDCVVIFIEYGKWKKQVGGWQIFGMFFEVVFIDVECWFVVEFVKDIVFVLCYFVCWFESFLVVE